MADTRFKNRNWRVTESNESNVVDWSGAKLAVLMDVRDELQTLNKLLGCQNFTTFPQTLRRIERALKRCPPILAQRTKLAWKRVASKLSVMFKRRPKRKRGNR